MKLRNVRLGIGTRRLARDERGAAAVELALILPFIMLILLGTIEFGRAWNVRQTLVDAAREGARVAAVGNSITEPAALRTLVENTVRNRAETARLDLTRLTVAHAGVAGGAGNTVSVTLNYQYAIITSQVILRRTTIPMSTTAVMRNE
jgi:Flp pilus assembly protein TadG